MITVQPHLRWPNEGFHDSNGKKHLTYDKLSLPQWVAGQLTNIYAMSDPVQVKQAELHNTILCTCDITNVYYHDYSYISDTYYVYLHKNSQTEAPRLLFFEEMLLDGPHGLV